MLCLFELLSSYEVRFELLKDVDLRIEVEDERAIGEGRRGRDEVVDGGGSEGKERERYLVEEVVFVGVVAQHEEAHFQHIDADICQLLHLNGVDPTLIPL